VGGLLPPRSYGEWWQQARAGAAPVEVRGEAEDAGEWDWDASEVCAGTTSAMIVDLTVEFLATASASSFNPMRQDVDGIRRHSQAKRETSALLMNKCVAFFHTMGANYGARTHEVYEPLAKRTQLGDAASHRIWWLNSHISIFAISNQVGSPELYRLPWPPESTEPDACATGPALPELDAGVPKPTLRPGMPSLLTPNASQHPDTDEIVYLLQHLGPWCDAGRSYPEAMGGLRALGGALRRRYSRGVAQVLLFYQHSMHLIADRMSVYDVPAICVNQLSVFKGQKAEQAEHIAGMTRGLCKQNAYIAAITGHNVALTKAIQTAGLWEAFLETDLPELFVEQLGAMASARSLYAGSPAAGQHAQQQHPPTATPTPHSAAPTVVLDATGQVRELAHLSSESEDQPRGVDS